jgi:membrane protein YqaA with SNARE-associated domain
MTDNQSLLIDDFSGFFELSQFPAIFAKGIANAARYFLFFGIVHDI